MALKSLMLRKKIDTVKKSLEEARAKKEELEKREAELATAIEEAETEEEKKAVEEEVEAFEAEKKENEEAEANFEQELEKLEADLEEEEKRQSVAVKAKEERNAEPKAEKREENTEMHKSVRTKFFGMTREEKRSFFENEEVKSFLTRTRELARQERAVTGAELTIPSVVLDLIREKIEEYSKLYSRVNRVPVPGKARQNVLGTKPEGVWTEMIATLNELSFIFNNVEVDGYKVGGFVPIGNAWLEDSDENLAQIIIDQIGAAIGFALDKAIIYGTGTKMPIGIFTRLAQQTDPRSAKTDIPWVDLHTKNIVTITTAKSTGITLLQNIVLATSAISKKYSKARFTWVMNNTTHTKLIAEALGVNAAAAIVAGMNEKMPVLGGDIVELEFIPNDVIIVMLGDMYLLAERKGATFAQSEHVRFIEDQTVFKGTARYDGVPVIAESFMAIGINSVTPTASGISFANDAAN